MEILKGLLYSSDHEWIKVEGNKAYIGISDFAQSALGEIVFVELPEMDSEFSKDEAFGVIESVKAASDLLIPIGGKVVKINESLTDNPSEVNSAPYDSWLVAIEISNKSELDELLNDVQYEELCSKEG